MHVLVARLDNDGDVLLTGPAIRAVAAGGHRVTYLCRAQSRPLANRLPGVADVVSFDAPWIASDPVPVDAAAIAALVDRLRSARVDQAIILTSFHQSPLPLALLLRLADVPEIAGISIDYPGSLLDVRHQVPDDIHEVERNLSLVSALGHRLTKGDSRHLQVLRESGGVHDLPHPPYVVIHPGASVPARALPPSLATAAAAALTRVGHTVVVTGGPGERGVVNARPGVVDLSGETDLAGLIEIVAAADAIVVGNTGPAHLAAAVRTPVVSVYAPTVPAVRWRPWLVDHVLLGNQQVACAGCRSRVCPFEGQPCTLPVTAADVVEAVGRLCDRPAVA